MALTVAIFGSPHETTEESCVGMIIRALVAAVISFQTLNLFESLIQW